MGSGAFNQRDLSCTATSVAVAQLGDEFQPSSPTPDHDNAMGHRGGFAATHDVHSGIWSHSSVTQGNKLKPASSGNHG